MGNYHNHYQLPDTVRLSMFQQGKGNLRNFLCRQGSSIRLDMVSFYTIPLDSNSLYRSRHNHCHLFSQLIHSMYLLHKDSFLCGVYLVF